MTTSYEGKRKPMSRGYIKLNLVYTFQAFIYLFIGLVLMILNFSSSIIIQLDSVYIMWLFGFVVSMVFGITNIMIPSYGNGKEYQAYLIVFEILALNLGIIITFITFSYTVYSTFINIGLSLLLLSVVIHLYNIASSRINSGKN
jgi:hypothetical protein